MGGCSLGDGLAALRAKLGRAHFCTALSTQRLGRLGIGCGGWNLDIGVRCHVDAAGIVDGPCLLLELLACGFNFRLRLTGSELFREIRRACRTQIRLAIPTDLLTDPVAAAPALTEIRAGFLNRLRQCRVVKFPADHALDLMSRGSGSTPSAQKVTRDIQQRLGYTDRRCLKLRHVSVAALVTMKFELVSTVRGQVVVVMDELNERHVLTIVVG